MGTACSSCRRHIGFLLCPLPCFKSQGCYTLSVHKHISGCPCSGSLLIFPIALGTCSDAKSQQIPVPKADCRCVSMTTQPLFYDKPSPEQCFRIPILQSFVLRDLGFLCSAISGTYGKFANSAYGSLACEARCADTGAIQALTVTGTSIQAANIGTGILVRFTVYSF